MRKILTILMILTLSLVAKEPQKAKRDSVAKEEMIDHVSLAAMLYKDGNYNRAKNMIAQANTSEKGFDMTYYHTLSGLIDLKLFDYKATIKNFIKAIEYGASDKNLYVYMANAHYKLGEYKEAIDALDRAGDLVNKRPKLFLFKIQAYWKLGEKASAIGELRRAIAKFPKEENFYKMEFFYLVEMGFFQEALDISKEYFKRFYIDAKTYVALATALKKSSQVDKAIKLMEEARLKFPHDASVIMMLGHLYIDKGRFVSASELFAQASAYESKNSAQTAEMFRRAKKFAQALYHNSKILDEKEKLKQRVAIFLEFNQFDKIVAIRDSLERSGLLDEENMRYTLAYAYYLVKEYSASEKLLKSLQDPSLFNKATVILKNMEKCKANRWECL